MTEQLTLRQKFETLPDSVREWLGSDQATNHVIELNRKLDLADYLPKVLPRLITKLVVKDLASADFISRLKKEAGIELAAAHAAAEAVAETILKPIASQLRHLGIDINPLYVPAQKSSASITPIGTEESRTFAPEVLDIRRQTPSPSAASPSSELPSNSPTPFVQPPAPATPTSTESPFILHQERPAVSPSSATQRPSVSFSSPRPASSPIRRKPTTATVESPQEMSGDQERVVHYSNLRTPLDKN